MSQQEQITTPDRMSYCLFDKADSSFWIQSSIREGVFQEASVSFLLLLLPALYFDSISSFLIPFSFSFLSP